MLSPNQWTTIARKVLHSCLTIAGYAGALAKSNNEVKGGVIDTVTMTLDPTLSCMLSGHESLVAFSARLKEAHYQSLISQVFAKVPPIKKTLTNEEENALVDLLLTFDAEKNIPAPEVLARVLAVFREADARGAYE